MPGFAQRGRQLTEARAANAWLGDGSVIVQQQALRDFSQAMTHFFAGTHRRPTWRKAGRDEDFRIVQRKLANAQRGSVRRGKAKSAVARLRVNEADRRKAPGRIEKVPAAYTSQCCSACGYVAAESRENQALFRCVACGYACNADVNAARNIAAGHAVNARGGFRIAGPVNREPQLLASQQVS